MNYDRTTFQRVRIALEFVSVLFTITGVVLIMQTMFSADWQIAYPQEANHPTYAHGLFRDCVLGETNILPLNKWVCFWKYDQNNHVQSDRFFRLRDYQESVLTLLGVSCGFGVVTTIIACISCALLYCSILWALCSAITGLLALIGFSVFIRNAEISDNRFVRLYNYEIDMDLGESYYITIGGFVAHAIATILAVLCVGLSLLEIYQNKNNSYRVNAPAGSRPQSSSSSSLPKKPDNNDNVRLAYSTTRI